MCCAGFDLLEGEAHALELLIGRQKYSLLEKIQQVLWTDQRFVLSYYSALFLQVAKIFVFVVVFQKVPALEIDSAPVLEYLNH